VDIFFAAVPNHGVVLYHVEVVKGVEWKGRQGRWTHNVVAAMDIFFAVVPNDRDVLSTRDGVKEVFE